MQVRDDVSVAGSHAEPKAGARAGSRGLRARACAPVLGKVLTCFWGANAGQGAGPTPHVPAMPQVPPLAKRPRRGPDREAGAGAGLSRGTVAVGGGSPCPAPGMAPTSWRGGMTC